MNKLFATYSFGSIAGQSIVYIPWGSKTNRYGPESIPQAQAAQKPLRSYEMIFAEIEWKPEGQNFLEGNKDLSEVKYTRNVEVSIKDTIC